MGQDSEAKKTVNSTNATLLCTDIGLLEKLARLTSWDVTVPSKAYDPAYMYSSGSKSQPPSFSICDDETNHARCFVFSPLSALSPPVMLNTLLGLGLTHHTPSGMSERHVYEYIHAGKQETALLDA